MRRRPRSRTRRRGSRPSRRSPRTSGMPAIASQQTKNDAVGPGMLLAQAAHLRDVARAAHRVHHRAGAEEQAGLEERVRDQVEDAGGEVAGADADEHEAELADRRVGQHLLDVVLREADDRREQRGERADDRDDRHRRRRQRVDERACARPCRRRRSPSSRRGSAPRPASGRPSRRAARRTAGSARTCRGADEQEQRRPERDRLPQPQRLRQRPARASRRR